MSMYTKLTMKATTTMSLNERFTALRNLQPAAAAATDGGGASTSTLLRAKNREQFQASLRNRRLAMQMASRPSVMAALKLKRKSLMQRLGQATGMASNSGVKARLGTRGGSRGGGGYRGGRGGTWNLSAGLKGRLGVTVASTNNQNRPFFRREVRTPLTTVSPTSNQVQGRGSFNQGVRGRGRGRGGFRGGMQFRSQQGRGGGGGRGSTGPRGGRGAAGNRGRGRGWNRGPPPSREALDTDLDQYMSRTKMTIS